MMRTIGLPWQPRRIRTHTSDVFEEWGQSSTHELPPTLNMWDDTCVSSPVKTSTSPLTTSPAPSNQFVFSSDLAAIEWAHALAQSHHTKICGKEFGPAPLKMCVALRSRDKLDPRDSIMTCRSCKTVRIPERSHIDSLYQPSSSDTSVSWVSRPDINARMECRPLTSKMTMKRKLEELTTACRTQSDIEVEVDQGITEDEGDPPKKPKAVSKPRSKTEKKPRKITSKLDKVDSVLSSLDNTEVPKSQ